MTTITSPASVRETLAVQPGAVTTNFHSRLQRGDSSYYVTEADGRVYEWNDFDAADAQLVEHDDLNAAVESIIADCATLYVEFFCIEDCYVDRTWEGDKIVAFRLSRDTDGGLHGDDEHFESCRVEW